MEILALLNPHSKDLRMLPPGFQHLTPSDISHAVSFIRTKGPRLVGRYKHAEQEVFRNPLNKELLIILSKTAKANKWKNIDNLQMLADVAVTLYCKPQRCTQCKGVGRRKWGDRIIICDKCDGSTWNSLSDAVIARAIGVDPSNFIRVHKERLSVAIRILIDWDRICCNTIRKSMRR